MKFLLKPVLALAVLALMATSAKAQDTLRISLKEAIQIALSENPTTATPAVLTLSNPAAPKSKRPNN